MLSGNLFQQKPNSDIDKTEKLYLFKCLFCMKIEGILIKDTHTTTQHVQDALNTNLIHQKSKQTVFINKLTSFSVPNTIKWPKMKRLNLPSSSKSLSVMMNKENEIWKIACNRTVLGHL